MPSATAQATVRSPFARLGCWRNPFGELSAQERVALAVVDVQPWVEFLESPDALPTARRALQFVGDAGYGKTTHLLVLESILANARRVYFPERGRRPPLPRGVRVLIVDEAQRMGWHRRRQMLRHTGPLVIGTHVDLTPALVARGWLVRTVDVATEKPARWIAEALNRRVQASIIDPVAGEVCRIDEPTAAALARRFHGNLRAIEHFLFDAFQAWVHKGTSWPPAI